MAGWRDVPSLVRHSTVAIYNKSTAGGPDGFIKALRIARDTLAKSGYLYHGAKLAVLEDIRLTGKGWQRNQKHLAEGFAGAHKDLEFARLFKMIEPRLYELDGPGGKQPPKPVGDTGDRQDEERGNAQVDNRPLPIYPTRKNEGS